MDILTNCLVIWTDEFFLKGEQAIKKGMHEGFIGRQSPQEIFKPTHPNKPVRKLRKPDGRPTTT